MISKSIIIAALLGIITQTEAVSLSRRSHPGVRFELVNIGNERIFNARGSAADPDLIMEAVPDVLAKDPIELKARP